MKREPRKKNAIQNSKPNALTNVEPLRPDLRTVEAPDLRETFADAITQWYFDGHVLRIEFAVSRLDSPQVAGDKATGRRYPVCRLVLTPAAVLELLNRAQQTGVALEKMGLVAKASKEQMAAKTG